MVYLLVLSGGPCGLNDDLERAGHRPDVFDLPAKRWPEPLQMVHTEVEVVGLGVHLQIFEGHPPCHVVAVQGRHCSGLAGVTTASFKRFRNLRLVHAGIMNYRFVICKDHAAARILGTGTLHKQEFVVPLVGNALLTGALAAPEGGPENEKRPGTGRR